MSSIQPSHAAPIRLFRAMVSSIRRPVQPVKSPPPSYDAPPRDPWFADAVERIALAFGERI